jgi:LEA14-like dessication related protein
MKKIIKPAVFILILGLLGLVIYLFLQPKKALQVIIPDLNRMENIHITLSQDTAFIEASLDIENKSLFKLDLDSLEYRVQLDTATLLSAKRYLGLKLKRSQKDTLHLPLALPFKRLRNKIRSLQGLDSVDVPVHIKLVYSTVFGKAVLHYSKTLRIEVPRPPEFEIVKVDYLRREKKTGFFMVYLKLHNRGKIRLSVSDLHYRFEAPELFTARGREQKEVHIQPRSTTAIELPVEVKFKSIFKVAGRLISNHEVEYYLKITGLVGDETGRKKVPVEIEKRGRTELR